MINTLLERTLQALQAADTQCIDSANGVFRSVSDPGLRDAIVVGIAMAERQVGELASVFEAVGVTPASGSNAVIFHNAIDTVRAIREAPDAVTADLGVITTSRVAFRYYVVMYQTAALYASVLGHEDACVSLTSMMNELIETDRVFHAIERRLVATLDRVRADASLELA